MISKTNKKAKLQGVFKAVDVLGRNSSSKVYYRIALREEADKFLDYLISEVEKGYRPLVKGAVNNSVNLKELFSKAKNSLMDKFLNNSRKIIAKWWKKLNAGARKQFAKQFIGVKTSTDLNRIVSVIMERNIGLIQNTMLQTVNNVENVVYDGMTRGSDWVETNKTLKNQSEVIYNKIKRITNDQTEKANSVLNEITQRSAGIEFFEWCTAHDERVSTGKGGHKQLDGKIYKWGDTEHYPITDSYGNRGTPQNNRPNCRCVAKAVILMKEYTAKQLSDGSWEIKGVIE